MPIDTYGQVMYAYIYIYIYNINIYIYIYNFLTLPSQYVRLRKSDDASLRDPQTLARGSLMMTQPFHRTTQVLDPCSFIRASTCPPDQRRPSLKCDRKHMPPNNLC